jgi:hypothetical protein
MTEDPFADLIGDDNKTQNTGLNLNFAGMG